MFFDSKVAGSAEAVTGATSYDSSKEVSLSLSSQDSQQRGPFLSLEESLVEQLYFKINGNERWLSQTSVVLGMCKYIM